MKRVEMSADEGCRCRDRKGAFTVETTAWEGAGVHGNGEGREKPFRWDGADEEAAA